MPWQRCWACDKDDASKQCSNNEHGGDRHSGYTVGNLGEEKSNGSAVASDKGGCRYGDCVPWCWTMLMRASSNALCSLPITAVMSMDLVKMTWIDSSTLVVVTKVYKK